MAADLFEVQTADRTGWFLPKEPSSASEEIEIQTLYTYIMEIESTPSVSELSGDTLYRLLPPGIRSLIRAYNILRKWAICILVAPQIGIKARQSRMELFLEAIKVCRIRSSSEKSKSKSTRGAGSAGENENVIFERPCVRSFVEAVLMSAIISPESRIFTRAWQNVANVRGAQAESLHSLLAARTIDSVESMDRLTVDPAWLLERILEVISFPDVQESAVETSLSLINFDKRRYVCKFIFHSKWHIWSLS